MKTGWLFAILMLLCLNHAKPLPESNSFLDPFGSTCLHRVLQL